MSDLAAENFPEGVALEVIKWPDTKSLKNVMLTSKENYNKVVIKGWAGTSNKSLEFFEKHGADFHELVLSSNDLTNASFWCKVLNTMPNLMKVVFEENREVSFSDVSDDELPSSQKLKTLELDDASTAVLKLFKKCQLHTVIILGDYLDRSADPSARLWNFLATQKDLKELKLDSRYLPLFETPVTEESIRFRLRKFSVGGSAIYEIDNLMRFMELQKDTLEDLELLLKFPHYFYEFVLREFNSLKTLNLALYALYTCKRVFQQVTRQQLEVNENVTSLQLSRFDRAANTFVRSLPNVQKLVINGPCDYLFARNVPNNMKQLKSLDMNQVEAKTFDGACFPALESLRIRKLTGRVGWGAFTKNSPRINELWIGDVGKSNYLYMPSITRNLKLRKLTIEGNKLKCNEEFFEVIRQNCPELKSLELNEESLMVDISTVADIPGLRFRKFQSSI